MAAVLTLSSTAAAAAVPVEAQIEHAAHEHLLALAGRAGLLRPDVKINVVSDGRRAATGSCPHDIEVQTLDTRSIARMRFVAICSATPGWRTEFVVRGAVSAEVVVAASAVTAGRTIGADDVLIERRDVSAIPDALSDIKQVVGKVSTRTLISRTIIGKRWLAEPLLVKRGDGVDIIARREGVEVQVKGEALEAGHHDDVVRVRNTANGRTIRARVLTEHTVEPADLPP
jgi:flagella basal body P-ring formation protein FlgA